MHDKEQFKNQLEDLYSCFLILLERHLLDDFRKSCDSKNFQDLHELERFEADQGIRNWWKEIYEECTMEHIIHGNVFASTYQLTFSAEETSIERDQYIKQKDSVDDQIDDNICWIFWEISVHGKFKRDSYRVHYS